MGWAKELMARWADGTKANATLFCNYLINTPLKRGVNRAEKPSNRFSGFSGAGNR
jgi:hypothetical protein